MSKTYTTVQGDMWDKIAFSQLGSSQHLDILINANRKYREYYIFPSGIRLNIPDVPQISDSLAPPWKR